jgi:mannose-6-phosphate isomerase-like protein (cupin superfamily)
MPQHEHPDSPMIGHRSDSPDAIAPDGSEIRLLVDQRHKASRASLVEVRLPAGGVSRPVWHRTVEEIWYVLEGHGRVWRCPPANAADTVEPALVGPGDALTIPTGWRFQFSADKAGPLRFLCYTSPPWPGPDEAQPAEHGGLGEPTV